MEILRGAENAPKARRPYVWVSRGAPNAGKFFSLPISKVAIEKKRG